VTRSDRYPFPLLKVVMGVGAAQMAQDCGTCGIRVGGGDCAKSSVNEEASMTSSSSTVAPSNSDDTGILVPLDLHPTFNILDLNLYESAESMKPGLQHYYRVCTEAKELLVTTSCFSAWRDAKKTNGGAKVIPAVPTNPTNGYPNSEVVRIFFFDDNINLHCGGSQNSDGICNLRDIRTGEFVDFAAGQNGFSFDRAFEHTVIAHSTEYRNVLIQANILDAMLHEDYFTSILEKYSTQAEKLLVFADVNGTVVWDDAISCKGVQETLLSTMFRFAEVRPESSFELRYGSRGPITVSGRSSLKALVNDLSQKDSDYYRAFWRRDNCFTFLSELENVAQIAWQFETGDISAAAFFVVYDEYLSKIAEHETKDGIITSWFKCYEFLKDRGHAVVLNSFGTDSRRVVVNSVADERKVLQITVNYGMWGQRDVKAWNAQFSSQKS